MPDHAAVWAAARPYMRARQNAVHIPMSYDYAQRLLAHHPEVDGEIVSLAREILQRLDCPAEIVERVVEIVIGHDTRRVRRSHRAPDRGRLFTEAARVIARSELDETRRILRTAELAADPVSS